MASPPFNIAETTPGDSDIVSQFPAAERTFRDVVEDWLLTEHDTMGRHKIPNITEAARDALTSVGVGTLVYNTDTDQLQICIDDSPVTWIDVMGGLLTAEAGTRMTFQQTAAPTGWTKDSTHNNKALRLVTGTVSTGGSTAFTSVFTSRTVALANLPSTNLSLASLTGSVGTTITNGTGVVTDVSDDNGNAPSGGSSVVRGIDTTEATLSLASGTVTFGGSIPLGGSGTAMDFAVQYVDFIIAQKD